MGLITPFVGNKVIDQSTILLNTARDSVRDSNSWLSSLKARRDVVIAGLYLLAVETPVNLATVTLSAPATATVGLISTFVKENQEGASTASADDVDSTQQKKPTLKERMVKILQTISQKTQSISAQQLFQRAKRTTIVALTAIASLVLMLIPIIPAGKISISLFEKAGLVSNNSDVEKEALDINKDIELEQAPTDPQAPVANHDEPQDKVQGNEPKDEVEGNESKETVVSSENDKDTNNDEPSNEEVSKLNQETAVAPLLNDSQVSEEEKN